MIVLLLWSLAVVVLLPFAAMTYLAMVLRWEDEQTTGLAYYGLEPERRAHYKQRLRFHAIMLAPVLALYGRFKKVDFRKVQLRHVDISLPGGACDAASAARAEAYLPQPNDIFVATQMKCGTTWMEHIVYEVLHRGNGNLVATGATLYGIAPWLEGRRSVPLEQSHPVGTERPSRIIKTHLPGHLCPSSAHARYIYVARHPLACFASCIDFIETNVGRMAPAMPAYEEWFRSPDLMWWGTWPAHVKGWWARSQADSNVLFLHFEEMGKDLPGVVRRVAEFLGVRPLDERELANVVEKCGFAYMKRHQDNFEMQPPHLLQTNAVLFVRGTADRHGHVPADVRTRMLAWAAEEMQDSDYPLARNYPDVVGAG